MKETHPASVRSLLLSVLMLSSTAFQAQAFYHPDEGRWISRDPIGEEEGGPNLYIYIRNAQLTWYDLLGLLVSGWYDRNTGIMVITDDDTGEKIILCGESGGKPYGDPIPAGGFDILDHPNQDFFRLDAVDKTPRNDIHEPTGRTHFRLHKPGRTIGCIAAKTECGDCWGNVRDMIRKTKTEDIEVTSQRRWPLPLKKETIKKFGNFTVKDTSDDAEAAKNILDECKCSCGHTEGGEDGK